MKQSDLNHLRRLIAYERLENGPEPEEIKAMMQDFAAKGMPEPSPEAKPMALGTDRQAAIQKVLDLSCKSGDAGTVKELWRLYQLTDDWKGLAEATRADYEQCSGPLLKTFGPARASMIRPTDINRYLRVERKDAPVRANREAALLSNLFNLAVSRGDLELFAKATRASRLLRQC